MPEAPTATLPAATPPAAASPESAARAAAAASPPIHVTPGTGDTAPAPKPGTARERLFTELRKKAGVAGDESPDPNTGGGDKPPAATDEHEGVTPPAVGEKKPKINPWKLLDEYKEARKKAESEVAELRKLVPNEKARKEEMEKLQHFEARAKELEEEIRYVNYTKSQDFQEKYQKPYEKAWKVAMDELKDITLTDPTSGETRTMNPEDLLDLVNMPLARARETAKSLFGDFHEDVMAHRKELRTLFERQNEALAEARKNGEVRDRERRELFQRRQAEFQNYVAEIWKQANEEAINNQQFGKLFQPIEGDNEGNDRLKKGYDLVDKAFAENPADPNLTPEQRVAVIKRHAAVRNRAAAFGRLRYQNEQLSKKVSELEQKLKQFEASTPSPSSVNAPAAAGLPEGSARAQVFGALHKLAK